MKKIHANSLLFKVVGTVISGIVILAVLLSVVNITISKKVFVDNFAESQQKIFSQIDSEFYDFYRDMTDIMSAISGNENMETYLTKVQKDETAVMENRYLLNEQLKNSKITDYNEISVFILGQDGKSYLCSKSDIFASEKDEIWNSRVAEAARANMNKIICKYEPSGFTNVMKSEPVVMMAKAWSYSNTGYADAIAFITIKESDIRRMYSHFTSRTSDIVLLNQDNEVISSDNREFFESGNTVYQELDEVVAGMTGQEEDRKEIKKSGSIRTYLMQKLQSTNYKIVGIINPDEAFKEHYNVNNLVLLTLLISAAVVCLLIYFLRQQAKPLGVLVKAMKNSKDNDFKGHVPVEGTYEVREVSETYNRMVDELDKYITQLIRVEEDKRTAEIHALQMQINPHYMYNTLASIKWLIWQGDAGKSTKVIDAFISLLRNVISNSDEFVTVGQEIENLNNYVLINQARYGDAIKVEFFVMPQCNHYKVPKLILQPFVENAFFHAFPEGRTGRIQVFVKETGGNLKFDITDNGVGIRTEQLMALHKKENRKSEHFTGIGIGNVDDRIKLIYGLDYGINIFSEEEKGTTITLVVPKREN